ncbi:hypothetical protein HanRHA438_Chr06g0272231 [Helianthus annuus]|nr:hypothetical protein HanRHA438_Chr06g0272231 [Helianthus annuus]
MLRCKTILNRNNYRRQFSSELATNVVVLLRGWVEDNKSTSMKKHHHWKLLFRILCGHKYAEPELPSWIHLHIVCLDTIRQRWRGSDTNEFEKTLVQCAIFFNNKVETNFG